MMKWIIDDPARFLKEREEINRLENEADWITVVWTIVDGNITVDFDMAIHGRTYAARMTYPEMFPNTPPYIRPRDSQEHWSRHQYGAGGSLCLQWRADNWQTSVTGADMILSVFELIKTENHPDQPREVPSEHRITDGQALQNTYRRFICTNSLMTTWVEFPLDSVTTFKTVRIFNSSTVVTYVSEVSYVDEKQYKVNDLPEGITECLCSLNMEGFFFKSEIFNETVSIESVENLMQILKKFNLPISQSFLQDDGKYKKKMVAIMGTTSTSLRIFQIEDNEQPRVVELKVIIPGPLKNRLPYGIEQLDKIKVGIIGLGSVGSKIAISLARSGVRQFVLVDDDYLTPGNIVRHELSWIYVGTHKVEAASEKLKLIAPNMQITTQIMRVAGQESSMHTATTLKTLSNCNLLIDATANPNVFLVIAAIARQYKIPLCWGEVFAGGYGGLIARARPGLDPNPLAVRDALYTYMDKLPLAPYQDATSYNIDQEEPLIAHDSDVGFIATSLTRLVLDTLTNQNDSDFPNSAYLIGMRKEWIFKAPFDTRPIELQGDGWDSSTEQASDEVRRDAIYTLLELCKDTKNDNADSSP